MIFETYENAKPILEEYPPSEALGILLRRHGDEFSVHYMDAMVESAELCLTETDPQFLYITYCSACVQMRWDMKQQPTYSF